ncbi:flavin reductase [Nocardioides gansuensis]|uniref:Flavin reductase n=1 Tax=Nocardioides gansuensis TaxID=2138300 RepID=A0A2T8FAM9_9ACTN|nr:flavin reductase family protein [Nocardioides gansuensis]PVG82764.1 flavin reductase [Nocardioides gansuensis]
MTIHSDHPFATPEGERDQARRLRGRLGGQVSLWTAGAGAERVGLTVSSLMVAPGEPAYVLGLLDPDSDLAQRLTRGDDPRCVVQLLHWWHRDLAEMFAGLMPAPGGAFGHAEWVQTGAGPRLADATTWAECVVSDTRDVGWSVEVTCRLDEVEVGEDDDPLLHRRGRYHH